jgi:Domain of unknown function (DUF1990)
VADTRRSPRLLTTAVRWPVGLLITAWAYLWRVTPLYRREVRGTLDEDGPPSVPVGTSRERIQWPREGSGAFMHRRYRVDVVDGRLAASEVMERIREDVNRVVPGGMARFRKVVGAEGPLSLGDEFVVRMPGPWDGPVRVIEVTPCSFRFATLEGHLEAGQIEWGARDLDGALRFEVESWSRPGDRVSDLAHHRLHMAKEVQLHMWTSVLENVVKLTGGRMRAGVDIHTAVLDA